MDQEITAEENLIYEIIVRGELHENWSGWLEGLKIQPLKNTDGETMTKLSGRIRDQAALRGTLNKIWDMHLTLISVKQVDMSSKKNVTVVREVSDE